MNRQYTYAELAMPDRFRFHCMMTRVGGDGIAPHSHEFAELVVILAGSGEHEIDGTLYPIEAGDVYVLHEQTTHAYHRPEGLQVCNILYDPRQFLSAHGDLQRLPGFHALFYVEPHYRRRHRFASRLRLSTGEMDEARRLVGRIEHEFKRGGPGRETLLRALMLEVVVYLSRAYGAQTGPRPPAAAAGQVLRLSRVLSHIEEHWREPLTLGGLARLAHMSPNQFLRVFRRCYKATPLDYVLRLRLGRAAERLAGDRDQSISEVALAAGFNDSNYFARQFRRIYEISPREYRRRRPGPNAAG
jgi:AraC family L-rhamnose operon transcriptional activator RhaR/AraC family L-rhamnose operon regulatory protein RhaS